MTGTLISLISIVIGIIGANITGYMFKKYSFGLTGNSIAGVFGSIFLIKTIGRMGFDPNSIIQTSNINYFLIMINFLVSYFGGSITIMLLFILKRKMNPNKKDN